MDGAGDPTVKEEIKWYIGGQEVPSKPKLPYVGTWSSFNKLPDEEKSKLFNAMRAELITSGKMENKGG
jgi:hypothetical protein